MRSKCKYEIVHGDTTLTRVVLRDRDEGVTITNDAEAVVYDWVSLIGLSTGQRLLYYDTDGVLTELIIENGRFAGFAPGRL